MSKHSVIFCGTPEFAVPSLRALIDDPHFDVLSVITQPDKPVGRKQIMTPPPVKIVAEEHDIPIFQPKNINTEFSILNFPFSIPPDFLVVVAYGQLLKQPILDFPKIAPVNLHASLLPRWRGASPMQQALLSGDKETGVTLQRMVKKLDAGDILAQEKTPITESETIKTLHDRLATMGAKLLLETLSKPLDPHQQDESQATECHKLSRKDGEVDPKKMTAGEIDLRVRSLVPWPGVTCEIDGQKTKLLKTSLEEISDAFPLPCKDGTILYIETLQPPGKKPMSGVEWKRGRK